MTASAIAQATTPHLAESARPAGPPPSNAARPNGDSFSPRFIPSAGITHEYLQEALTTRIGQAVQETLGAFGVDIRAGAGVDVSPEAVAGRIFEFTTGALSTFARQHPELDSAQLIDRFEATIRGAVDKGYGEAVTILDGLEASSDVRQLGESTMARLDTMYDEYFSGLRASLIAPGADPTVSASARE